MKSGLYAVPGDSATARAAATARRLAEPTTKFSKRNRGSGCTLPRPRSRAELPEDELRDAAQRLEDAVAVQRVGGEVGDAPEVERVLELRHAEDEVRRQVLLVVLDHE